MMNLDKMKKSELLELALEQHNKALTKIKKYNEYKSKSKKGEYNISLNKKIKDYSVILGKYKIGKKKGKLKKPTKYMTKPMLRSLIKISQSIERKDIKTRKAKQTVRNESAEKAYQSFINEKFGKKEEISEWRQISRDEFDLLTKIFNHTGKKLLSQYGSEQLVEDFDLIAENSQLQGFMDFDYIGELLVSSIRESVTEEDAHERFSNKLYDYIEGLQDEYGEV